MQRSRHGFIDLWHLAYGLMIVFGKSTNYNPICLKKNSISSDLTIPLILLLYRKLKYHHYQTNLRSYYHCVETNPISLTRFKFISISIYLLIFVSFAFDDKTDKYKHCFIEFHRD